MASAAYAQSGSSPFELIASSNTSSRGSNFVIITSAGIRRDASATEVMLDSPTRGRLTWDDVAVLRPEKLRTLAQDHSVALEPVFAVSSGRGGRVTSLKIIGLRNKEVWSCSLSGGTRNMQRLGRVLELDDTRLEGYEQSVLGGKLVVAYEGLRNGASHDSRRDPVTAILQSQEDVYSVSKLGSASFNIAPLGMITADE